MKKWMLTLIACVTGLMVFYAMASGEEMVTGFETVPQKGMVTMVDLGAKKCVPCKMMAPILDRLDKEYRGRAAIVFIDVWKHNDQARRFKIRAIPTQIFFDESGKEIYRHVGFLNEKAIVDQLSKMGVKRPEGKKRG